MSRNWPSHRQCARAGWVCALLLLGLSIPGGSAAETTPAPGMLLVAVRGMSDPNFAGTVVLLVQHNSGGSLGLVLNRPVPHRLDEALPGLELDADVTPFLFQGGPVGLNGLMFLFRSDEDSDDALRVMEETHLGSDRGLLAERLEAAPGYAHLRVFIGHAGWAPGQLEHELARGDWLLVPATDDTIWTPGTGDLWQRLIDPEGSGGQLVGRPHGAPS
ncbi:MAG: YqgE/AlgH family protein [Chromatiales bacterium]|jgi:putative transcriptional regulator